MITKTASTTKVSPETLKRSLFLYTGAKRKGSELLHHIRGVRDRKLFLEMLEAAYLKNPCPDYIELLKPATDMTNRIKRSVFSLNGGKPKTGEQILKENDFTEFTWTNLEKALVNGESEDSWMPIVLIGEPATMRESDMMMKSARLAHNYIKRRK